MTDATIGNALSPLEQLLSFADWEDKYNQTPGGQKHIARWAYEEIIRLREAADSRRDDVIEECARVCDRRCDALTMAYDKDGSSYAEGRMDEADSCAQAIRALKGRGSQ